jgi:hypothetical protein
MTRTVQYNTKEERKALLDAASKSGEMMLHDDFGVDANGKIAPPHTLTFDTFIEPPVDPNLARIKALRSKIEDQTLTHAELVELLKIGGL